MPDSLVNAVDAVKAVDPISDVRVDQVNVTGDPLVPDVVGYLFIPAKVLSLPDPVIKAYADYQLGRLKVALYTQLKIVSQ